MANILKFEDVDGHRIAIRTNGKKMAKISDDIRILLSMLKNKEIDEVMTINNDGVITYENGKFHVYCGDGQFETNENNLIEENKK